MKIQIKRIYDTPDHGDGVRILVDRIWPRGVSKAKAAIAFWAKDIAPSDELRKWYRHDPKKWDEFRARYVKELDQNRSALEELREHLRGDTVTLVFSSKETRLNNAQALKEYLEIRGIHTE
ncbi:MAG: DUF488 domain-containing protein [Gammaproteobacteria bacterium]